MGNQLPERHCLLEAERAGARALQPFEVRTAPETLSEVVGQRPDVEAARAHESHLGETVSVTAQFDRRDGDLDGLDVDGFPLAREFVGRRAANFLGGVGRWGLQVPSSEGRHRLGHRRLCQGGDRGELGQLASAAHATGGTFGVVGLSSRPDPNPRDVLLVGAAHERREPGGAADDEREHTGRERIEGSGMADARQADRATHDRDDVVRGRAGGFVDDKYTVHVMLNADC